MGALCGIVFTGLVLISVAHTAVCPAVMQYMATPYRWVQYVLLSLRYELHMCLVIAQRLRRCARQSAVYTYTKVTLRERAVLPRVNCGIHHRRISTVSRAIFHGTASCSSSMRRTSFHIYNSNIHTTTSSSLGALALQSWRLHTKPSCAHTAFLVFIVPWLMRK